tara:strand:- start:55 stop:957 length:903 start_codon:yes stop_codon:yes gene_type:complete
MSSSFTTRIRLEKQGDGENANTWGTRLNQNVIDMVDEAVAGYESIDVSAQSSITLTAANGTTDQSRNFGLRFTGALAANCTVVAPSAEKIYYISNETSGGKGIVIKSGSAKTTVTPGGTTLVATDGTNISKISSEFESGTRMAFAQAAAPTGWTVETCATYNNAALRIITAATSGTGGGTAGSNEFNTAFSTSIDVVVSGIAASVTGDTGSTTLTVSQLPAHTHTVSSTLILGTTDNTRVGLRVDGGSGTNSSQPTYATGETGGNQGHTHSLNNHHHVVSAAGSFNLNPKYVNFIVCTKD